MKVKNFIKKIPFETDVKIIRDEDGCVISYGKVAEINYQFLVTYGEYSVLSIWLNMVGSGPVLFMAVG